MAQLASVEAELKQETQHTAEPTPSTSRSGHGTPTPPYTLTQHKPQVTHKPFCVKLMRLTQSKIDRLTGKATEKTDKPETQKCSIVVRRLPLTPGYYFVTHT